MKAVNRLLQIERRTRRKSFIVAFQHTDGHLYTESEWSGTPGQRVDVASLPKGARLGFGGGKNVANWQQVRNGLRCFYRPMCITAAHPPTLLTVVFKCRIPLSVQPFVTDGKQ